MVILLVPVVLLAVTLALWQGASFNDAIIFTICSALAAFGAWAMGRELAPDDQAAAFVAMFLSVITMLLVGVAAASYGLLVLFTTLGLVRQVNRTTGLEARLSDSIILLGLSLWVIYSDVNPLFGLVAAFSYFLDGYLQKPLRRQWVFALLALGAFIVYIVDHDMDGGIYALPQTLPQWTAGLIAVIFALNLVSRKEYSSVADVGRKVVNPARIRGGMLIALIAVIQGLPELSDVGLIAAVLAGVCLTSAFRRSFTNPV